MATILDIHGNPISTARFVTSASHDAGAFRDPIASWFGPQISSWIALNQERITMQRRAEDLASNDWAANSALSALSFNSIGTGLVPQSSIPAKQLGITKKQATELSEQMEWAFSRWTTEADICSTMNFADLQMLGLRNMLSRGEMLHLAIMLSEKERLENHKLFSLTLQAIKPQRLRTPGDLTLDSTIRDGIRFSPYGKPLGYYIVNPQPSMTDTFTPIDEVYSQDFTYFPARIAHRTMVFHLFRHETEEQTRGISTFASGMTLFRNLSDALNYELMAQVMAASMPTFIATENNTMPLGITETGTSEKSEKFHSIEPGAVYYGDINQKPYSLESKRPSANFSKFVEIILRAMAASQGIPYETLAKDYSKTNYSSMRAALNEAWKLYDYYRSWFARQYCQPIWEMVVEEAWLRGMFTLPDGAPDFYDARDLWCNANWVGPAKGFVDPVKEIQATILALQNKLTTMHEAWAERGGDWDEASQVLLEEQKILQKLNVTNDTSVSMQNNSDAFVENDDTSDEDTEDKDLRHHRKYGDEEDEY